MSIKEICAYEKSISISKLLTFQKSMCFRSEPFYEKGGTVKQVTIFLHKKIGTSVTCSDVEKAKRFRYHFLVKYLTSFAMK